MKKLITLLLFALLGAAAPAAAQSIYGVNWDGPSALQILPAGSTMRLGTSVAFVDASGNLTVNACSGCGGGNFIAAGDLSGNGTSQTVIGLKGNLLPGSLTVGCLNWTGTAWALSTCGGGGGSGTVTSFSSGNLSPLFNANVATATSTPALTFSLLTAAGNTLFGNCTGTTAPPVYCSLTAAMLPATAALTTNSLNQFASTTSAQLASILSDETGTGLAVFNNGPTLVAPILGTPASGTLTNATGLPISTGLSGAGTGVLTFLATPSSANLAAAITDETGSGAAVFATSPSFITPNIGSATASGLTLTGITGSTQCLQVNTSGVVSGTSAACGGGGGSGTVTSVAATVPSGFAVGGSPVTTTGTLALTYSVAAGGQIIGSSAANTAGFTATPTLGASGTLGSLTFGNGTSGTLTLQTATGAITGTVSIPSGTDTLVNLTGTQTLSNKTFVAPALGTPASGTLTNATGLPVSTGISGLGTGVNTFLATPSSANLASAITDETGTGKATFATSPAFLGTPDASGATQFKQPVGAGFATLANGEFGYDTTNNNVHVWQNAADRIVAVFSGALTTGHCPQITITSSVTFLTDSGSACGSGGGNTTSTSLTSNFVPKANGANSIINSALDDGATTANTLTYTGTGGLSMTGPVSASASINTGTGAGTTNWTQGALPSLCPTNTPLCIAANSVFIAANATEPSTPFGYVFPTAAPTVAGVMIYGAPTTTSGVTSVPWANGTLTNASGTILQTETGTATNTALPEWNSSGDLTASLATDNGTTFNYTGAGGFSGLKHVVTGAVSAASWTTTGVGFIGAGSTYTDTTSTGTVPIEAIHAYAAPTLAASATTTVTNGATWYIAGPPTNGTNVTITNPFGLYISGSMGVTNNYRAGGAFESTVSTGNASFCGGLCSAGNNNLGGSAFVQGNDTTSTGTSAVGGSAILRGGMLTATTPNAAALEGLAQVAAGALKGSAIVNVGDVVCGTTTAFTLTDCLTTSTNVAGIATATTAPVSYVTNGQALVKTDNATTVGDFVCFPSVTAGLGHDNGTTACPAGMIGVVLANSGALLVSSVTGNTVGSLTPASTLPLVQLHISNGGSGGGGGTPCTTTALSLQYNNAGAFGCLADFTFSAPHTILVGASGIIDLHSAATGGLLLPGGLSTGIVTVTTSTGAISSFTPAAGVQTFLTTPTSANLATAVTDETGSSLLVFNTSPTLVTPLLGTPTSGVLTNTTGYKFSSLAANSASVTLAQGNFPTIINCAQTTGSQACGTFGETTAATASGDVELQITTLTTSTAPALQITQGAAGPAAANAPAIINVTAAAAGGAAGTSQSGFAGSAIALLTGAGSAGGATTGNGGTGGAFTMTLGAGGAAGGTTGNNGGAGGAFTITGGAGVVGAATGGGGAATAFTFAGAAGGAGGATSGTGGAGTDFLVTTGTGGAATVGSTTGRGGNFTVTLGSAGATGTAGLPGKFTITGGTVGAANTTPTESITGTWNTTGVVDAALLINITNTASGAASKLFDAQVGSTSQFAVDKAGNTTQVGSETVGAANCTTFGSAGGLCSTEGTSATNVASTSNLYPDSTAHEWKAATAGSTSYGTMVRAQPGAVRSTALVASVSTATLCAASAGACNVPGTYHTHFAIYQSGTACTANTTGGISVQLTWTDGNGTTHSAVTVPLQTAATITAPVNGLVLWAATTLGSWATGDVNVDTNGTIIQYATTFSQCNTGTATYALSAVATRLN